MTLRCNYFTLALLAIALSNCAGPPPVARPAQPTQPPTYDEAVRTWTGTYRGSGRYFKQAEDQSARPIAWSGELVAEITVEDQGELIRIVGGVQSQPYKYGFLILPKREALAHPFQAQQAVSQLAGTHKNNDYIDIDYTLHLKEGVISGQVAYFHRPFGVKSQYPSIAFKLDRLEKVR
ncbi:MAG: hypothetical protein GKR89_06015 [Candidatus Latescibacteria bacterium]|nr:hypothetical protein [Candidatus Latescibacterota bacterium]